MRAATGEALPVMRESVVATVVARTGMGRPVAEQIVEARMRPSPGLVARGVISMTDPPARFYPKRAKALRFVVGGRVIFRASVRGSRPYRLISRGAESAEREVEEIYDRHVEEVLG